MPDTSTITIAVGSLVAAIIGWFGKRQLARLDSLERNVVTKDDIEKVISKVNTHVTERTQELKLSADAAHDRIDSILMQDRQPKHR